MATVPVQPPAVPASDQDVPAPPPGVQHAPFAELTIERTAWVLVVCAAAGLRLADLGRASLTDAEAVQALASFDLWRGATAVDASPLYVTLTGIVFALFGANDLTARIVPALAGTVPVVVAFWMRDLLGRVGALIAAVMLAVSATYLFHSRVASGEMLALAGITVAVAGCHAYLQRRGPRALIAIAAGVAAGLTSASLTYTVLLILATAVVIALLLRARRVMESSTWDLAIQALRSSPHATRPAILTFVVISIAGATAGLVNPLGLQWTIGLAVEWFSAFTSEAQAPPAFYVDLFIQYEHLALAFGLLGLFVYLAKADRLGMFLAWWLAVALTIYTLAPVKTPAGMLVILLPLYWAGGRVIDSLLRRVGSGFSLSNEGPFAALGLVTLGIIYVNLAGYAQDGLSSHLAVVSIGAGMLLMLGVMIAVLHAYYRANATVAGDAQTDAREFQSTPAWGEGTGRAGALLGVIVLSALGATSFSSSMNLNFRGTDDPREAMVFERTTLEASALTPLLEGLSNRWEGDPSAAAIVAHEGIGPALRWYLRNFRDVRYVAETPLTAQVPIVIVPAGGVQPGFATDYASQRIRWRWLEPEPARGATPFLRWLLYRGDRDVHSSYDIIVYVQQR